MELKNICSNCIGIDKCNRYCEMHVGTNLLEFIRHVDYTETEIGEFRTDHKSKKVEYIVSGHAIENYGTPTYILSDLSISIDASGKFISCGGETPQQILRAYLSSLDITQEVRESVLQLFRKFNSSKFLPLPLKPGAECEITYKESSGKMTTAPSRIVSVHWNSDRSTGKIACVVYCSVEKGALFENNSKIIKIPIIEYGENIRLPQLERTLKSSELDREMIKMTDVGFIKPIQVTDGKYTLAIDNQYLYRIVENRAFIIGVWKNSKIKEFQNGLDEISKSPAYKKINNASGYIERHRRFIVPFGLFELNKIEVK